MLAVRKHPDEFTLLRYAVGDLSRDEMGATRAHLAACNSCETALARIQRLDRDLRRLASAGGFEAAEERAFHPDDPFRSRPSPRFVRRGEALPGLESIQASEVGLALQEGLLAAIRDPDRIPETVSRLSPERPEHRFALLYALQEAGRRSAENPFGAATLAGESLRWLRRTSRSGLTATSAERAERIVPRGLLRAQARLLLGIACLWDKEYSKAGGHLLVAYRSFGRAGADLTSLAAVELAEAQRRGLAGEGATALPLLRRARQTFEETGLEDYAARAMVAEGLALSALGRPSEAVDSYRKALPIFEKYGLWSNYVGALNSVGTALLTLNRVDEARREFARALRRFSQESHKYWLGYLRMGLAEVLFAAGHHSEAAVSAARAARIFEQGGLRALSLIARLLEIECWARSGGVARALHRLELFWTEIERDGSLDRVVVRRLEAALTGADPTYERLSSLRREMSALIQERYRAG